MGRYLAIGLVKTAISNKDQLRRADVTVGEWATAMQLDRHYDPSIFFLSDREGSVALTLMDNVIEKQLLQFLEAFYPKFYPHEQEQYIKVLQALRAMPPDEWMAASRKGIGDIFKADDNPEQENLTFDNNPLYKTVEVKSKCVNLSLEGKLQTEGIDNHLNFFKYCIHEAFAKYPIAKAIRVYTTG